MNQVLRFLSFGSVALGVTLALFALMYQLVRFEGRAPTDETRTVDFQFRQVIPKTPPPKDPIVEPEPVEPKPMPPVSDAMKQATVKPTPAPINIESLSGPGVPVNIDGASQPTGAGNAGLVPLVRIQPQFPRRAALAGTSGSVTVTFTVTETGSVVDPRIVASNPPRVFDRSVLDAIVKWRFRPQTANGEAVRVRATQTFAFDLDE